MLRFITVEIAYIIGAVAVQTVGVVVGTDADDGIIGNPGGLQLGDQRCKRILQLQLIADVVHGILLIAVAINGDHLLQVLRNAGVTVVVVGLVPVAGHVIDAEGLLVDVGIQRLGNHVFIVRIAAGQKFQAISVRDELIVTQVHVGNIAVIVGVFAVVIANAGVTETIELAAHGEIIVVVGDVLHGISRIRWNEAHEEGVFARRGRAAPRGLIGL